MLRSSFSIYIHMCGCVEVFGEKERIFQKKEEKVSIDYFSGDGRVSPLRRLYIL